MEQLDFQILDWIQEHLACAALDRVMPWLTRLGDHGILWIATALFFLLWRPKRRCGVALTAGLLGSLLIGNVIVKNLAARPRPCWIRPDIALLIASPTDYSFPSGHTLASFIAATILLYYDKRFGIPALILAVIIAFSRLYLYVHFPSDVLGGVLLGIAIGIGAIFLNERVLQKIKKRT